MEENPLKMRAPGLENDASNFDDNILLVFENCSNLVLQYVGNTTRSVHAAFVLFNNNSFDIISFLSSYAFLKSRLEGYLFEHINSSRESLQTVQRRSSKLTQALKANTKVIVYGNQLRFFRKKIERAICESRRLAKEDSRWSQFVSALRGFSSYANSLITFALIGEKVMSEEYPSSLSFAVRGAISSLGNDVNWEQRNAQTIQKIKTAKKSVQKILDQLEEENELCKMERKFNKEDMCQITLRNFSIGVATREEVLLEPTNMIIPPGVTAVTGVSGCGKSSFLSKVQGIRNNGISSEGEIIFQSPLGEEVSVWHTPQEILLAPCSNLFEIIAQKSYENINREEKDTITEILSTLKLDGSSEQEIMNNLDKMKDWGHDLSGGQRKKIAIASMLFHSPSFVILDEVFTGLDPDSVKLVQEEIKKRLPSSVILVVDHHAEANNYDGFYDQKLHIEIENSQMQISEFGE